MSEFPASEHRGHAGRGPSHGAGGGGKGSGGGGSRGAGKGRGDRSGKNSGKNPGKGGKHPGKGGKNPGKGGRGGRGEAEDPAAQLQRPLEKVLARLPETQRKVLELRMGLADGHPHDLGDTARALGLSLSEAREIERRAFDHIREAVPLQQLQRFLDR